MNRFSQNRILKGNVSIMVILILLACSLMGILTVVFLKSLITYTDDTYSYHKSYYIAKAGLELALTEIDNSAIGFSHDIDSGNTINGNFECVGCHFTSHIQGRSKIISNDFWHNDSCTETGALVLQPGQSLTIPMFYDSTIDFNKILSNTSDIQFLGKDGSDRYALQLECENNCNKKLNIGVVFQQGGLEGDISWEYLYMTDIQMDDPTFFHEYFKSFDDFEYYNLVWAKENYYPYIVLSNSETDDVKFCIEHNSVQWPTTKYFISSLGEYMGKTVGLQAIYAQPTPSFFINPSSSYGDSSSSVYAQNEYYY